MAKKDVALKNQNAWDDWENFGDETDENYIAPIKNNFDTLEKAHRQGEKKAEGLRVPEFKNNASALLRPNIPPESINLTRHHYPKDKSTKSPNETESTEAAHPSHNT